MKTVSEISHGKQAMVFSAVSESNVAAVTQYIATQEEHHKKQSFQEEFITFLKKNNVPYDEKYLWD